MCEGVARAPVRRHKRPSAPVDVPIDDPLQPPDSPPAPSASARAEGRTRPSKDHARAPDSMKVGGKARFNAVAGRAWTVLHASLRRDELRVLLYDFAHIGGGSRARGCAVHVECTYFLRTTALPNDCFLMEESGEHSTGAQTKKHRNPAQWTPLPACVALSLGDTQTLLQHYHFLRKVNVKNAHVIFECAAHPNCHHTVLRRKSDGGGFDLLEDLAHPDGSTGLPQLQQQDAPRGRPEPPSKKGSVDQSGKKRKRGGEESSEAASAEDPFTLVVSDVSLLLSA